MASAPIYQAYLDWYQLNMKYKSKFEIMGFKSKKRRTNRDIFHQSSLAVNNNDYQFQRFR